MSTATETIAGFVRQEYKYGFVTDVEADAAPPGLNEDINPLRVRGIIDAFCHYFPAFGPADFEGIQPWRGLRPCSPDGLPYIGRFRQYENLSVATGHAMMGLSLGPITGKLMADVLSDQSTSIPVDQLSPDRYSG